MEVNSVQLKTKKEIECQFFTKKRIVSFHSSKRYINDLEEMVIENPTKIKLECENSF